MRSELAEMRLGLETMREMDAALGHPSRAFASIHVGGTNGKGSVVTKIAASLRARGVCVGLYTSPHIDSLHERIRVNGGAIAQADVEEWGARINSLAEQMGLRLTFFEEMTLMAFLHFAREGVEIAVLEVGLGGRLDATNIVTPLLSIITSIDYDHQAVLGSTLEAIGREKAGIIKPGIPVVVGPSAAALPLFRETAQERGSPYLEVVGSFAHFEEENRAIARQALAHFFPKLFCEEAMGAVPPCRFERLGEGVLLDVAHNPHGVRALLQRLAYAFPGRPLRFVLGLSQDKERGEILSLLFPRARWVHFVEAPHPRAASVALLAVEARALGYAHFSTGEPLEEVRRVAAEAGELLVVCGSFFLMASVKQQLGF